MAITKYKNLQDADLDKIVWRYLTFAKYISLLAYGAIWFSKLNILIDKDEGAMPAIPAAEMRAEHQARKHLFDPSLHEQLDNMNSKNVEDGRELTVVNCWFEDERESEEMWDRYAGTDGIAIKSTIRALAEHIFCDPRLSVIGRVQYVDLSKHLMSHYEANQAHERAYVKGLSFSGEREIRITTMNFRGPACVNMDGTIPRPEEYEGPRANNFQNPGIFIKTNTARLIHGTVVHPGASVWFELLVRHLARQSRIGGPVTRSTLEGAFRR
jgi:hypothetical protein